MHELLHTRNFSVMDVLYKVRGIKGKYQIITKNNTVLVIPVFDDGGILMERQWRYPIKKYIYELPAGMLNKKELPKTAASRELLEETGYSAGNMDFLFKGYPAPGIMDEMMYFYLATKLKKGKERHLDKDEVITTKKISLKKAIDMIRKGEIVDTKTVAAILYYSSFLNTHRL